MAFAVHLMISADSLGDAFLDAAGVPGDPDKSVWTMIPSVDWRIAAEAPVEEQLEQLTQQILPALPNRSIDVVEIRIVVSATDPDGVGILPALFERLNGLRTLTSRRRIYVIHPQGATALPEFRRNFQNVLEASAEADYAVTQVSLLESPNADQWSQSQQQAYRLLNWIPECRSRLDEALAGTKQPCTTSGYCRLVYDRTILEEYYLAAAQLDLLSSSRKLNQTTIRAQAEQHISDAGLLERMYAFKCPLVPIGAITPRSSLRQDLQQTPVQRASSEFLSRRENIDTQTMGTEKLRLTAATDSYQKLLISMLDKTQDDPIHNIEQTGYFHQQVQELMQRGEEHQRLYRHHVVEADVREACDAVITAFNQLSGETLSAVPRDADAARIRKHIDFIEETLAKACETGSKLHVWGILMETLSVLKMVAEAQYPDDDLTGSLESLLREPALRLDKDLDQLRTDLREKESMLAAFTASYGLWDRWFRKRAEYIQGRQAIEAEIRAIDKTHYRDWATAANAYLAVCPAVLRVHSRLQILVHFGSCIQESLDQAGDFLLRFDRHAKEMRTALKTQRQETAAAVRETRIEIPVLDADRLQQLYERFPVGETTEYTEYLLHNQTVSWGKWATGHLDRFLENLPGYCRTRWQQVPRFDLARLLLEFFPNDTVNWIRQLLAKAEQHLLPLVQQNEADRRYLAIFVAPQDLINHLQAHDAETEFLNRKVSLVPARTVHLPGPDPDRLQLALTLYGFTIEEYLFWGIFNDTAEA